jgi:hypothetical protein
MADSRRQNRRAPVDVASVEAASVAPAAPAPVIPSIRPRAGGTSNSDSEVHGFVLYLASFVLFALYLLWAFVPDAVLHQLGLTYYPDKWWSVALPAYFLMALLFVPIIYFSLNLSSTAALDDLSTIRDGWTRQQQRERRAQKAAAAAEREKHPRLPSDALPSEHDAAYSIEEIVDVPIERVNRILYTQR